MKNTLVSCHRRSICFPDTLASENTPSRFENKLSLSGILRQVPPPHPVLTCRISLASLRPVRGEHHRQSALARLLAGYEQRCRNKAQGGSQSQAGVRGFNPGTLTVVGRGSKVTPAGARFRRNIDENAWRGGSTVERVQTNLPGADQWLETKAWAESSDQLRRSSGAEQTPTGGSGVEVGSKICDNYW
ncbi:hypothetical protein J6590_006332 [Homalodisca vitripennis]|nr:hypothetical protein J6590_006332 [Homalodisca vitripennis]